MFGWRDRSVECSGIVLFRGLPPRLENFSQFAREKMRVTPITAGPDELWAATLEHGSWGKATIRCARNFQPVPRMVLEFDARLDDEDRQAARSAKSAVLVTLKTTRKNILGDRKLLLRFMRSIMDNDGLIAMDMPAHKFWPRDAMEDELAHDADLDIESLFVTHLIHEPAPEGSDAEPRAYWAHTHGLAELGALDFDILRPSPLLTGAGYDTFRSVAFLILEGEVGPGTNRHPVILPRGECSFVSIEEFNRNAPAEDIALRDGTADPDHNRNRLVLCDPRRTGLLGWLGLGRVRPSRLLSTIDDEHMMCIFTTSATELMADRARRTFELFQKFTEEFREFEVQPLVKLGHVVDGGDPTEREHMWFEVNGFAKDKVDATLLNQPFNIARMKAGDRAQHGLEVLTDWQILTPVGSITPREMIAARRMRANREKLREVLAQHRKG
ncbi:MAG TPA: DUF4026 domain-containing protein [Tepidisphaeraceae bacterium]|jgi:hypothetical protein|nr:DUF4026 domain-containing protein [Tepidisphaeraceae bacterium]